jgi:hypothetical protein
VTRRVTLALICGFAVACSEAGTRGPTPGFLLASVGSGYVLSRASGPVTASAAAAATDIPPASMTSYLDRSGFRSGAERIWTSARDGFVTDLAITIATRQGAAALPSVAKTSLGGPGVSTFTAPGVPGGIGFVLTGDVKGGTSFCVTVVFAVRSRAFVVTRCTPYPQDTTYLADLAVKQLRRAS